MNRLPRNISLDLGIRLGFWVVWGEPGLIGEGPWSHSTREILLGPKGRREGGEGAPSGYGCSRLTGII